MSLKGYNSSKITSKSTSLVQVPPPPQGSGALADRGTGPPPSRGLGPGPGPRGPGAPGPSAPAPAFDPHAVLVSRAQNGNPLLRHIRNVRWRFADIVPDFLLGQTCAATFISLRYHLLHPAYLGARLAELQRRFRPCVVLCLVDAEDVVKPMNEVNKIAAMADCSLLCAWSPEEAARYVETLKAYERKSNDVIREKRDQDYHSRLAAALAAARGVNKVDAATLGANFGSLAAVMRATERELAACPGLGPTKVKRLRDAMHAPFRRRRLSLQPSGPAKEIVEPPRANAPPKNPQKGSDGSTEEDGEQRANAGGTSTIP